MLKNIKESITAKVLAVLLCVMMIIPQFASYVSADEGNSLPKTTRIDLKGGYTVLNRAQGALSTYIKCFEGTDIYAYCLDADRIKLIH